MNGHLLIRSYRKGNFKSIHFLSPLPLPHSRCVDTGVHPSKSPVHRGTRRETNNHPRSLTHTSGVGLSLACVRRRLEDLERTDTHSEAPPGGNRTRSLLAVRLQCHPLSRPLQIQSNSITNTDLHPTTVCRCTHGGTVTKKQPSCL